CQQILLRVDTFDSCVFSCFDALSLAAFCVSRDVARFILLGPLTVCTGDLLACYEHSHVSLPVVHLSCLLHFRVDHPVDFHARLVVGRNNEGSFRLLRVFMGVCFEPFVRICNFMDAPLCIELLDCLLYLSA